MNSSKRDSLGKELRTYLFVGNAPDSMPVNEANYAFNRFVEYPHKGIVLFEDHFVDSPGGAAIFSVQTSEQLRSLINPFDLKGWKSQVHPLLFAKGPTEFMYTIDYSLGFYNGKRLTDVVREYETSRLPEKIHEMIIRRNLPDSTRK